MILKAISNEYVSIHDLHDGRCAFRRDRSCFRWISNDAGAGRGCWRARSADHRRRIHGRSLSPFAGQVIPFDPMSVPNRLGAIGDFSEDEDNPMRAYSFLTSITAVAIFVMTQAAYAGVATTPGPVAAVGAPALVIIGGAVMAVRYFRSRSK